MQRLDQVADARRVREADHAGRLHRPAGVPDPAQGKYLPLPLDKVATIVSTRGMFYSTDAAVERLIFPDWSPKTSRACRSCWSIPQGTASPT